MRETLGHAMQVDVTLTCTISHILLDWQQDNAPCHTAEMVQDWSEEHNKSKVLNLHLIIRP